MNKLKPIAHGTWQGYKQHRYRAKTGRDEECPGNECKKAWAHYCTMSNMRRNNQ